MTKKTPLFDEHLQCDGRIVDFEGWLMPVQYSSILEEHRAVRTAAGLFDVSHMGEFFVSGKACATWLNGILTNDAAKLSMGQCHYTFLLNEQGGVIDDLILYRLEEEKFLLIVNASKIDENFEWMLSKKSGTVVLENASDDYAAVALQGPNSVKILERMIAGQVELPKRNRIVLWKYNGEEIWISRTGYTGEDGFECFFSQKIAAEFWRKILEEGKELGCAAAGLGARDLLRLEACLPLNGHDLSPEITPIEAGFEKFVSLEKKEHFPGRTALENNPPRRALIAFVMSENGALPRGHCAVYRGEEKIGEVTSGGISPMLQKGIGLALVERERSQIGNEILIEVRGKKLPAMIQPRPLYKKL
ncbi:MAG: glycine cleavage system aminomethyltransferase GcvT [Verrucomicrobiota bacterium]